MEEKYIIVHDFMIKDLNLKGNELLIYAVIYGFSQTDNHVYSGSLRYLAERTNSTKQGVLKCLKSLTDKGYITKKDMNVRGVKFVEYRSTKFNGLLNKVEWVVKQSLMGGIKQSLPNNKDTYNKEDNKEYIKKENYIKERKEQGQNGKSEGLNKTTKFENYGTVL